jgi:hypothetical protein
MTRTRIIAHSNCAGTNFLMSLFIMKDSPRVKDKVGGDLLDTTETRHTGNG